MAAKKTTKQKPMGTDSFAESTGGKEVESPLANTGAAPVYRVDMGESLPPQADAVQDRKKK